MLASLADLGEPADLRMFVNRWAVKWGALPKTVQGMIESLDAAGYARIDWKAQSVEFVEGP